ncbi:MAG: CBS domain-containing protein [Tannerellaceae bacterium]|jgi:CBS domain-containing protein|nr:CBS domain-containing protein [Tannerellaceae bacterium]
MLVKDFITKEIPVLKISDTVRFALSVMDDLKLRHLPLVTDGDYRCLVSEKDLLEMPDLMAAIGEPVLFAPSIKENGHLHELIARMARYHLCLLPVVSAGGRYLGAITGDQLIEILAGLCHAEALGSVIVLDMWPQDYVLSDIARIVEDNNAHIMNLFSTMDGENRGRLAVTIKIDLEDATPVIRSFERFNYKVLSHFMETGIVDEVLQRRMNELLYYMNM